MTLKITNHMVNVNIDLNILDLLSGLDNTLHFNWICIVQSLVQGERTYEKS